MKAGVVVVLALVLGVIATALILRPEPKPSLVPLPAELETRRGNFTIQSNLTIVAVLEGKTSAERFAARLRAFAGIRVRVQNGENKASAAQIVQDLVTDLPPEGYRLSVSRDRVHIQAATSAGFQYASETLLQLLPPAVYGSSPTPVGELSLPAVEISDAPRFAWRGLMLDVSRHFFSLEEVQRLLDLMAVHKLNTFHWHLTDDEGWRLEIQQHPALTSQGAWREGVGFGLDPTSTSAYGTNGLYGGYYSQEQVRALINYASGLHIQVVPEIELPSHAAAALRVYPELLCLGEPYSPETGQGLIPTVFCAGNEKTFDFLEQVFSEVIELFPGKYIHIGGDEVPERNWRQCPRCQERMRELNLAGVDELQAYFMHRVARMVTSRGKIPIAWGEKPVILPDKVVLMDWAGGAVEAATARHDVVVTPSAYTYLNMYQSRDRSSEPRTIGGLVTLEKAYSFEPIPANLPSALHAHILGPQACLWTEYIASIDLAEYMLFPRLCALAEVGWTLKEQRQWNDFSRRMQVHARRLDALNVNAGRY